MNTLISCSYQTRPCLIEEAQKARHELALQLNKLHSKFHYSKKQAMIKILE